MLPTMSTSFCWLLTSVFFVVSPVRAQTTNGVDSLLSEAFSVYTEVTSILASDAQTTATSTPNSSASTTPSTTSTTTSSSSITSMKVTPSSTTISSASLAGAASTTSAASSSNNHNPHHNNLAIILGSVLGAFALGLLILCLLICCHRRRRSHESRRHGNSPGDEEVESWRGNSRNGHHRGGPLLGNQANADMNHSGAPSMSEHPAFRHSHENPFVPVIPPPRRSAPNSRAGLTDGTIPGQEPFISRANHSDGALSGRSHSRSGIDRHHHGEEALAAGAGGVALGAAATHHHNRNHDRNSDFTSQKRYSGHGGTFSRRPVPASVQTGEKYDSTPLHSNHAHELDGNDYNKPTLSPFNSAGHARSPSQEALLKGGEAAGIGALGGAAVAEHRKHNDRSADSSFYSSHDDNPSAEQATRNAELVSPISELSDLGHNGMPPDYTLASNDHQPPHAPGRHSGFASPAAIGAHTRNSTPPSVPSRSPKRTRFSDIPHDEPGSLPTSHTNSDDSTFQLPRNSMPGEWRRDSPTRDASDADHHLRNSGINQTGRRSNSPRTSADATTGPATKMPALMHGVGPGCAGPRRQSSPNSHGVGPATRRQSPVAAGGMYPAPANRWPMSPADVTSERVRLSDLRADEELMERERLRGRQSEWAGYHGHHGVGQAL